MNVKKKMISLLCAISVISTGCSDTEDITYKNDSTSSNTNQGSSITMSLDDDGNLSIKRLSRNKNSSQDVSSTWNIFVYMCGTDLESENGMASMDIDEMIQATAISDVKFIVQTGGTYLWDNDFIDSDAIQRYEISNGEITLCDEQSSANMGESSTLTDFLKWGIDNYSSERMGLIFWNHGGGSISGVCFDENYDYDSLSLREIDASLLSVYDDMPNNFEFIGFDACLMSTIETANILATYSNYMYASQETEPGYGWDYTAIGDIISENPTVDGKTLGKVICDSFYDSCKEIDCEDIATLSVVDLSKIDNLISSLNDYSKNLYEVSQDSAYISDIIRNINSVDNYGGNNKSEGYTNMVDLAGIIQASSNMVDGYDDVLWALDDVVVYCKNGADHSNACGLSTYYPLKVQGSLELSTFGDIAVSPYYLSFVDKITYSASNNGDTSSYDNSDIFDFWGIFDYQEDTQTDEWSYSDSNNDYWSYCDDYSQTGESPFIQFCDEPSLDDEGSYWFSLTDESLLNTASVQANVYMCSDDGYDLIELGISTDIFADWSTGVFYDNFDGYWISLPDGQNLAIYIVDECDGYDIYTSPILLNDKETNLRITHNYVDGTVTIDGAWDGIDENGMASKEIIPIKTGDKIIPMYYATTIDSDDEYYYYGEQYTFDGEPEIYFSYLPDGEYFYGFFIDDIYGDYYITDYVNFTVDGDTIYFE